jgi:hypothetical protein
LSDFGPGLIHGGVGKLLLLTDSNCLVSPSTAARFARTGPSFFYWLVC